jgi:hypothetical protein
MPRMCPILFSSQPQNSQFDVGGGGGEGEEGEEEYSIFETNDERN